MGNKLTAWSNFDTWLNKHPENKNLKRVPDINRLNARFRVANAEIDIKGYTEPTKTGYVALLKIVLVWGAYELFRDIFSLKEKNVSDLIAESAARDIQDKIRKLDRHDSFYQAVAKEVKTKHQKEINNFLNKDRCNTVSLAEAIRHTFVHGKITPNTNSSPETITEICQMLSNTLLQIIDKKFSEFVSNPDKSRRELSSLN